MSDAATWGIQTGGSRSPDGVVPCCDGWHVWQVDGEADYPQAGEKCGCGAKTWGHQIPVAGPTEGEVT